MTRTPDLISAWRTHPVAFFLMIAGLVTAIRVVALFFADANLGADEAQYWMWSKSFEFGYFSKPPLIAWTIAATTSIFGDAEWAVRLAAPLYHFGAAALLFALGRRLYDNAIGFWAGLGWLTLPGVTLSSTLMTTDAPLLFFWSAALLFFFLVIRLREQNRSTIGAALLLGVAVGLGLLAKYAMIYFLAGGALALVFSSHVRRNFRWSDGAIALAVAAAVLSPNAIWNVQHDFQTLSHVAANADWGRSLFHVEDLVEFLTAQFGVFGPFPLLLLIWGGAAMLPRKKAASASPAVSDVPSSASFRDRLNPRLSLAVTDPCRDTDFALLAFALPPLIIIAAQAFIARAHANWAAVAYPSAIIVITAWAFRARIGMAAKASVTFHLVAAFGFIVAFSNFAVIEALGLSNAVKRVRGWDVQGAQVRDAATGFDAILVDDRELMASLLYYARGGPPILARNSNKRVENHFEAFLPYDPAIAPRVFFVDLDPEAPAVAHEFAHVAPLGSSEFDLKRGRKRTLYFFDVSGFTGTSAN